MDITERSRKFYDGTYKFVVDGYTDEAKVYHAFDCYDPVARAPTPLPPMFQDEDSQEEVCQLRMGSVHEAALTSDSSNSTAEFPEDLFFGHADRDRLLGRFEGIRLVDQKLGTLTSIADCYRLCGIPYPEETKGTNVAATCSKEIPTPEKTLARSSPELQTPKKASKEPKLPTASPLSDCPTDISEWEEKKKTASAKKGKMMKKRKQTVVAEESPIKPTRGVAQKVVKPRKKTSAAAKAAPAPAPALLSTVEDALGRRRSARISK